MKSLLTLTIFVICFFYSTTKGEDKLEKKVKPFFVQIEFEILKNESPFFDNDSYDEFEDYVNHKKIYRTYGIPINENTIVMAQLSLAPERLKNIKIKTSNGDEIEGQVDGYGLNRMLQTIKTRVNIAYPKFKNIDAKKPDASIYETTIAYRELSAYLTSKEITSDISAVPFLDKEKNIFPIEETEITTRGISLLSNKKGEPLAMQTTNYYKFNNKSSIFVGNEIKTISLDELKEKEEQITEKIHKELFFIQINFRQNADNNNLYDDTSSRISENTNEAKVFGFLINEYGDLLLPFNIPIEKIKEIEKIEIHTPNKIYEAVFKGAYSSVGAILINCQDLKENKPKLDFNLPEEENLFFSLSLLWNSPDSYQIEVFPNYLGSRFYSIKDRLAYNVKNNPNIKETIFLNQSLEICAINSKFINMDDLKDDGFDKYGYGVDRISYISLNEIQNEVSRPNEHFDNRAIQLNRQDALAPTWLGVIVQAPSNALLEHLKVLDKTRNGLVGLLVTQVYDNSPGQTIGLKKLDILLSVSYKDSTREYEFLKPNEYDGNNFNQYDYSKNPPMELFPAIRNEVTNVLSKLETGKLVDLKYIRDGKLMMASFKLEKAPNDFSNASKYVDEDLGLHVKDVTFEVRESLHLKDSETGVIISEVEQGKACDIAKLHYYCIILKVDNLPITSAENFKEIITAKKAKGITEFYFTVIFLGKTSLIKVNLKS